MQFEAQLCPSVEGVMFTARHAGRTVRGLILREALEQVFGAGEEPSSWLQAYRTHAATIERLVCERYVASPGPAVLLLRKRDFLSEPGEPEEAAAERPLLARPERAQTMVSPWG